MYYLNILLQTLHGLIFYFLIHFYHLIPLFVVSFYSNLYVNNY